MGPFPAARSTLIVASSASCPHCDGGQIRGIGIDAESAFEWHECMDCSSLWGLPRGWTREDGSFMCHVHQGAAQW